MYRCIDCGHGRSYPGQPWYEVAERTGCDCCNAAYHCSECGQGDYCCLCCSSCGVFHEDGECSATGHYAYKSHTSNIPQKQSPWFAESGFMATPIGSWDQCWIVENETIDPATAACDFFLLSALADGTLLKHGTVAAGADTIRMSIVGEDAARGAFGDKVTKFYGAEARIMLDRLTERLAQNFAAYIDMAVGGELRHHKSAGEYVNGGLPSNRRKAWAAWKSVRNVFGPKALQWAIDLFEDGSMPGGYGGTKWSSGARLLLQYETGRIDAATFVNYTFSLQHNNGSFLNKLDWKRSNRPGWGLDDMEHVILPAHAHEQTAWHVLLAGASHEVREFWGEYLQYVRQYRRQYHLPTPSILPVTPQNVWAFKEYGRWGNPVPTHAWNYAPKKWGHHSSNW